MSAALSRPRRAAAELVGTFVLVLAGCGAIVVDQATGQLGHVGVAACFGLVVLIMIATLGHLSGAHLNPVVTLTFAGIRHFPWPDVPWYVGAQLLGASAAAACLRLLFGPTSTLGATLPAGSEGQALGVEIVLTAVLVLVIVAVATDTRAVGQLASIAIGATVALDALWGGPISGASMNPARSLGPALVTGLWRDHWIYWLGPGLGAGLAALLYQGLRGASPPKEQAEP